MNISPSTYQNDLIEAIKFRMEQMNMKPKDLAEVHRFKSPVSQILNKKRKLSLAMLPKLNFTLQINASWLPGTWPIFTWNIYH